MFSISDQTIDRDACTSDLENVRAGGFVTFEGWVRDHNQGLKVSSLEYQVYAELALKEGAKIVAEARSKFNVHDVGCRHRFGHLKLGEIAVWVGATASHRDDAFKACRYVIDEIKHRLPIWKKEHYFDRKPEWVFCRDHHSHVHFHESDYYAKQSAVVTQSKLRSARVLVIGAGGLGCPAATALAQAGIGEIEIADFDTIEISNVHRQSLYSPAVVGEKKAMVAQARLSELNPFIRVRGTAVHVNSENIEGLIANRDLVLDCTDNMRTKFLIHDSAFRAKVPLISASIFKNEGTLRTFDPAANAGCWRCQTAVTPDDSLLGNCNDFGVLGAATGTLGHMQASEAIRFLETKTNSSLRDSIYVDLRELTISKFKNVRRVGCACCSGKLALEREDFEIDRSELGTDFELLDIRGGRDVDWSAYTDANQKIAVLCDRGVRSYREVKDLRAQGRTNFFSVRGGACSLP